ncbi:MAG: hypothetical protein ACKPHU_21435 [Planctomycetaceae bacterium]
MKNISAKVTPKHLHRPNLHAIQPLTTSTAIVAIMHPNAKDPNAVTVAIDATAATDVIALTAPREQNDATTALQIRQPSSDSRPPHNKQHSRLSAHKTANDKTEMPAQIAGQDGQIVADLQIATASPQLMISATELTIN